MTTDIKRTLEYLEMNGPAGVHSFDLNHYVGTTRAAARINDLKKMGYTITSVKEKKGDCWGCRYYLNGSPRIPSPVKEQPVINYRIVGSEVVYINPPVQEALI